MSTEHQPVFIHGMVPREHAGEHPEMGDLWHALRGHMPATGLPFEEPLFVEWGHETAMAEADDLRPDQQLTRAQQVISNWVSYERVRDDPGPNNTTLTEFGIPGLRHEVIRIREGLLVHGLADVLYYVSSDGEKAVRTHVYRTILECLEAHAADARIHLYFFAHSLGVTLVHDFLFGLFAPDHRPGFLDECDDSDAKDLFIKWRGLAGDRLHVGALATAASQLPLMVFRNQALIERVHGAHLDPAVIGIPHDGTTHWINFWDIDDPLGYPTRNLYHPNDAIREVQVDCGDLPTTAHTGYWTNHTVIRETAALFLARAGA